MRRRIPVAVWAVASFVCLAVSACSLSPQLEATQRALQGTPRERARVYDACRAANDDRAGLLECMQGQGYRLAPRRNDPQSRDCWVTLDSSSALPRAYCFEKTTPGQP